MVEILYDGKKFWEGISTVPLFSFDQEYLRNGSELWGQSLNIEMAGNLTGFNNSDLLFKRQLLTSGLKNQFKTLTILENSGVIFTQPFCRITSLNFSESKYNKVVPYSISAACFREDTFGAQGVTSPQESWNFEQTEDGLVNVQHEISAQGFRTNRDALTNAREFCKSISGISNVPETVFLKNSGLSTNHLRSLQESPDRFNGSYSLTETYVFDPKQATTNGYFRFTVDSQSGVEDGITTVSVQGELVGGINSSMSGMQSEMKNFGAYGFANEHYKQNYFTAENLNTLSVSQNVEENFAEKQIGFNYSYDNFFGPNVYLDLNSDVSTNRRNDISTFNLKGSVVGRGPLKTRWQNVKNYFESLNLSSLAASEAASLGVSPAINSNSPLTQSIQYNEFAAEIRFSLSYSNKTIPIPGAKDFNATISVTPSIKQFKSNPIYRRNGSYHIFDLGFRNRAVLRVNGTAVGVTESQVRSWANGIRSQVIGGRENLLELDSVEIESNQPNQTVNFAFSWIFKDSLFTA